MPKSGPVVPFEYVRACGGNDASDRPVEVEDWRGGAVDGGSPSLRPGICVGEEPGAGRVVGDLDVGAEEPGDHC